jgi:cysteine-S-conjugate beta-lyase
MTAPLDKAIDLGVLRRRTSQKWVRYEPDVLPAFVAESDFPIAPRVAKALHRAIEDGDLGYAEPIDLGAAYATFARERYGAETDPADVVAFPEVMVGVAEVLRRISRAGDGVVINPPVYPPFFATIREVSRTIIEVPFDTSEDEPRIDIASLDRAFAAGARVYLLCNPHNPFGRVFSERDLRAVAEVAARYDVTVLVDEIHAPLVLPGAMHVPFEAIAGESGVRTITFASASKAWNIAGLKCAVAISSSAWGREVLRSMRDLMMERTGHLGAIATIYAFESDDEYLDDVVAHLDAQRSLLHRLLSEKGLGAICYAQPRAGYLAWLDCRALGLGPDPANAFLERGRVALVRGLDFGTQGAGFVRLNFATSSGILAEIVSRMAASV